MRGALRRSGSRDGVRLFRVLPLDQPVWSLVNNGHAVLVTNDRGRGVEGGVSHGSRGVLMVAGMIVATDVCSVCARLFSFDPVLVPTIEGRAACQHCIERVNVERTSQGVAPIRYDSAAYPV